MADNYIEKQYELYEARKNAWEKNRGKKQSNSKAAKKHGKRVFVTGGAAGIGKAIVRMFRTNGDLVAFCDTDEKNGRLTAVETGALFLKADVSHVEELEMCLERILHEWGDIDVLVNNAGISEFKPLTECCTDDFDRILNTNLRPVFVSARKLALHRKGLQEPNPYGGRIINLCSTRYLMSEPGTEGYAASKGGIYALTHALALSMAEWKITVNSIAPGWIENYHYETLRPEDHSQHPCGRVGRPEDIARMCLFLAQEENDFIDGENITIDGGMTKKMIYIE